MIKKSFGLFLLLMVAFSVQTIAEETKIVETDNLISDGFGKSIAVTEGSLIIGAPGNGSDFENPGKVIFFNSTHMPQQQVLSESEIDIADRFGTSIAVSGNHLLIGAPSSGVHGAGVVFAYAEAQQWEKKQQITAQQIYDDSGVATGDFGTAIAMEGTLAVIGAPSDSEYGISSGAVFVFVLEGEQWVQTQKITATDAKAFDKFGYKIDIHENNMIVSIAGKGASGKAVYLFENIAGIWKETKKITELEAESFFGKSVAICSTYAAVGAPMAQNDGLNAPGAVYVFTLDGELQQTLKSNDCRTGCFFGTSIVSTDDILISGAPGFAGTPDSLDLQPYRGAVYVFKNNGQNWTEMKKILASDGYDYDNFGECLAIHGDNAMIGAPGHDVMSDSLGAVYIISDFKNTDSPEPQPQLPVDSGGGGGGGCFIGILHQQDNQ